MSTCDLCGGYDIKNMCNTCPRYLGSDYAIQIFVEGTACPSFLCLMYGLSTRHALNNYIANGPNRLGILLRDNKYYAFEGRVEILLDTDAHIDLRDKSSYNYLPEKKNFIYPKNAKQ